MVNGDMPTKTEEEIRRAIRHVTDASRAAAKIKDQQFIARACCIIDVLRWTLGEASEFTKVVTSCDAIEKD